MADIRRATENDVAFLAGVLEAVDELRDQQDDVEAYRAWWQAYVQRQIHDPEPGSTLYVIESAGEPAGRLRVVRSDERVFLAGLQIHPTYQGKGIGTAVIGVLLDEARAQGLPLQLDVHEDNLGAQRLYRRLGFCQYGRSDHDLLMSLS